MRIASLALFSSLIVAAASAHISPLNAESSSSSSSLLLARADDISSSSLINNSSFEKRAVEEVEEVDVEEDDDGDVEEVDVISEIESRGRHRKHHKKPSRHHKKHRHSQTHHQKAQHHKNHQYNTNDLGSFNGKGTFFKPNQGACGKWNTASDHIVALSSDIYDGGKHCFEGVRICHGSKCANAQVADLCPGCRHTSLDMTTSLFRELADLDQGVIDIQWSFV